MSAVDKLRESAAVLQEVDVTEIISSLALGIAEAQQKLDNNSIQQLTVLADPSNGVNGKSLIELGFAPAFYHFQYADVSASISLKLKLKEETSFGISLKADYSSQKGFSEDKLELLEKTERSDERKEFRGSRTFVMDAKESNSLRIANSEVRMDQEQGSYSRVEQFEQDVRDVSQVDRVRSSIEAYESVDEQTEENLVVRNSGGFVTIFVPATRADAEGILKLADYGTSTNVDLNVADGNASTNFAVASDLATTYNLAHDANGGHVIGYSSNGVRTSKSSGDDATLLTHYFELDKHFLDFSASDNSPAKKYFLQLSQILKSDSNARITIVGSTDTSAGNSYNLKLSSDRCKAMTAWFKSTGVPVAQIKEDPKGETIAAGSIPNDTRDRNFRYVQIAITSAPDYLYFEEGGDIADDATPIVGAADVNRFIWLEGAGPVSPTIELGFGEGELDITAASAAARTQVINDNRSSYKYSAEYRNEMIYALHDETQMSYTTYSRSESEIEIESASSSSESEQGQEDTFLIANSENTLSNFKSDASDLDTSSTFAVGGSVDFRTARQFEIEMEGNASISARLVSLSAPSELLNELKLNAGS